ncbi:hypothetical protein DAPPUDRAFT_323156 [Daphnia pulex]|uniref:Uncharacterized protein n=1 Tax=Daphnia pulex TaxID=6669 RepID=E9GY25_DAPPU|nr:hypothetical protein DAPPUDRAFT_323156 [Daphnia pulex]|eukprot:EFX75525.1 hypothetical protein DAPPUDRAFT_323156 [Daphnia pulex]
MAPPPTKTARSSVKGFITKKINQLKTYDLVKMTLKTSNELEDLKLDLKETFEKFQQLSLKIQEDLNTMDAPQVDYETEEDYCRNVKEDINAARLVTIKKTKKKGNSIEANSTSIQAEPLAEEEAPKEQEPEPLQEAEAPIEQEFEEETVINHQVFQEPEDVITQDEAGPEPVDDLAPPDPAPMIHDPAPNYPDPAIGEVEPDDTGSGGEYVGNIPTPQQPISRSGRQSRLPSS